MRAFERASWPGARGARFVLASGRSARAAASSDKGRAMYCTARLGWVIGRRVYVELDPAVLYKAPSSFVDCFDEVGGQIKVERVCVSDLRDIEPEGWREPRPRGLR